MPRAVAAIALDASLQKRDDNGDAEDGGTSSPSSSLSSGFDALSLPFLDEDVDALEDPALKGASSCIPTRPEDLVYQRDLIKDSMLVFVIAEFENRLRTWRRHLDQQLHGSLRDRRTMPTRHNGDDGFVSGRKLEDAPEIN